MQEIYMDISSVLNAIISGIDSTFARCNSIIIDIGNGLTFSLSQLFVVAIAIAVLINILLPDLKSGDIGEDDFNDYNE